MLIAILIGVYVAAGMAAAAVGFLVDRFPAIGLVRRMIQEQRDFKEEILHHLREPAVDPKAFSRRELEEHPEGWFMRPAQRARAQRGH